MTATSQASTQSSPLISEGYRELQRKLHEDPDYGMASVHYAPLVADIVKAFPLNVTAGTRYPEKQLGGLGI